MKFALVGPAPPLRGGISQYNASLASALSTDHGVMLVSFSRQYPRWIFPGRSQHESGAGPEERPAVRGEDLIDSIGPFSWRRVARRIAAFAPDAVVFQWWHPFFSPAFTAIAKRVRKTTSAKILFLCHNVYPHERLGLPGGGPIEDWLIGRAFALADGFLVHSERLAEQVRGFNRRAAIRRVFHPSYDFYSEWDAPVGANPGSTAKLLFFGTIRPYKGLGVFLEALARLSGRLDFEATVAGEFYVDPGPLRKLAEREGLGERVIWRDEYVDNSSVPALFRAADLVVLPYLRATQSGVVPLAYHFERPVIASDVGGLSEVVQDGVTGYLVPPGDPAALADRIWEFFRGRRLEEFQANIRAFRPRLSWRQVTDNILDLLGSPPDQSDGAGR